MLQEGQVADGRYPVGIDDQRSYMETISIEKFSVNEVFYTNVLMSLIENMLCNKLHYRKTFDLKVVSYKIAGRWWHLVVEEGQVADGRDPVGIDLQRSLEVLLRLSSRRMCMMNTRSVHLFDQFVPAVV